MAATIRLLRPWHPIVEFVPCGEPLNGSRVKTNAEADGASVPAPPSRLLQPAVAGQVADADLVARCQKGDPRAFELLVARYQDRVFNLVYRMTARYEDAQDITQDVFLRALEHIGSFRQQASVYTWLFRIAMNMAISQRRRKQRVRFVSLDGPVSHDGDGELSPHEPAARSDDQPGQLVERDEQHRRLARAIGELDDEFRGVLVLKDIEGLDYQEIADVLELPLGTVKSRLHRARNELKARLGPIM